MVWPLNQHACLPFVTHHCMSAGVVLLYLLYLLVWCLTISRVCCYGVSLSAVPAGVVLLYRSYLLVLHTTISHVVPHYRSCLLVWCLTIVSKRAKIRNRYNQAPHLTQDTNGKVTTSQLDIPFPAGDHKHQQIDMHESIAKQYRNNKNDPQKKVMSSGVVPHYRPCLLAWYSL